jgi:hypothetical protein
MYGAKVESPLDEVIHFLQGRSSSSNSSLVLLLMMRVLLVRSNSILLPALSASRSSFEITKLPKEFSSRIQARETLHVRVPICCMRYCFSICYYLNQHSLCDLSSLSCGQSIKWTPRTRNHKISVSFLVNGQNQSIQSFHFDSCSSGQSEAELGAVMVVALAQKRTNFCTLRVRMDTSSFPCTSPAQGELQSPSCRTMQLLCISCLHIVALLLSSTGNGREGRVSQRSDKSRTMHLEQLLFTF